MIRSGQLVWQRGTQITDMLEKSYQSGDILGVHHMSLFLQWVHYGLRGKYSPLTTHTASLGKYAILSLGGSQNLFQMTTISYILQVNSTIISKYL